ncbi:MAG: 1-phosphofructokinase [Oscillospiraceae bacterium]|nr:1-phosphofructokinase [Oscillospiraceae bacterium]
MIYTLTLNPALDYNLTLKEFISGGMNRASEDSVRCGGKGINVSAVLTNLGTPNTALGFIAGFTGTELENSLSAQGIKTDLIRLDKGMTRICVKIHEENGRETEINPTGPDISAEALDLLMNKLDSLTSEDTLVLAGSVPKTVSSDIYVRIAKMLFNRVRIAVDASGVLLTDILHFHPFLIKPNHKEAEEVCGMRINSHKDAEECAQKLRAMGALNVVISMAEKGSVLAAEDGEVYRITAPAGKPVNTVGAGDSLLAGFLAAYDRTGDMREALRCGTAAGTATAFTGRLCTKEDYEHLLSEVHYG